MKYQLTDAEDGKERGFENVWLVKSLVHAPESLELMGILSENFFSRTQLLLEQQSELWARLPEMSPSPGLKVAFCSMVESAAELHTGDTAA